MDLDTFLGIASIVSAALLFVGYRCFSGNVYIRPKKYRIERYMK